MHSRWKLIALLCVCAAFFDLNSATAQTKKRLIILFPSRSADEQDNKLCLELVEIKIAGRPIVLDKPFDADDNWLKNMTLRVKNVCTKPIVFFNIGGELFRGIDEEPAWDEAMQYVIGWDWGKRFNPKKEKPKRRGLKPRESAELTYANVNSFNRATLALVKEGEGAFCKLKLGPPAVELY